MKIEIPFIGGGYAGRSRNLNAQVCQNLYLVQDKEGGKAPIALMGTPGVKAFSTTGTAGEVRGMLEWGDYLYVVVGATLYKVDSAGTAVNVGTLSTSTGKVWMAAGTTHICIVDGTAGYYQIAGAVALTTITDVDFPIPSSLTYQDGYFIVTEVDADAWYISASEDASSWDGLDFASAEDSPDDASVAISHRRELWLLGKKTTEVFYNSGNATFPFTRVAGAVIKIGLGAIGSAVAGTEGLFWLDDHYEVRMANGYEAQKISTDQIDYQISSYTTKSDAIGSVYTQEGHSFYVLTFPTESKTWVFDATTGVWHSRSSGLIGGRHRANCYAWFAGKVIVGDYSTGNLYELDLSTYTDLGDTIRRVRTAQPVHSTRELITFASLEIEFEAGVGLSTGMATLTAVLTAGVVTSVTIVDGGAGYTATPKLYFTGGGGTGAVATAALTGGVITGVTVITGGSGYTSAPTVTVAGGTQNPQAMLDWSDDGGHIWGNEHWTSIGRIGEYKYRSIWRRLGTSRNRIFRVTVSDAVKIVIIGAHLDGTK